MWLAVTGFTLSGLVFDTDHSFAAAEPGIRDGLILQHKDTARFIISRGVTIRAVNSVSSAVSEFEYSPNFFVPPATLMVTGDLAALKRPEGDYQLVLTENGVWGFLLTTSSSGYHYYDEDWIRRFNTARDEACLWGILFCGDLSCSADEVYAKIAIVTKPVSVMVHESDTDYSYLLQAGEGFIFDPTNSTREFVHALPIEEGISECEIQNSSIGKKYIVPADSVRVISIEGNLLPSFAKQAYVRKKKVEFISKGFVLIPESKTNTTCGDRSTYQLSKVQESLAKQSVSLAYKNLGIDGSYSIEWNEKISQEEKQTKAKSPSRETYSIKYISGDGLAAASLDKIANCEVDQNGEYASLASDADWFYQFRHEYIAHTFTFDCEAVELTGLLLDKDAGKIELNSLDDFYTFREYLGRKDILGSLTLLQKEITEWDRDESGDHCATQLQY